MHKLQVQLNLSGLIKECRSLIKIYNLPNIIDGKARFSKDSWNNIVKKCIRNKSESDLKKEFDKYSKLKHLNVEEEKLNLKDYVSEMRLRNAR